MTKHTKKGGSHNKQNLKANRAIKQAEAPTDKTATISIKAS
ncbi:hypothetical protein ACO0DA_09760 [Bacillus subtilis]|nr:hypothetical protein [Bacillus subtilis]AOR97193.1 hypothetical protein BSBS38_00892 [Bacillus subtilis]MDV3522031.1 hypothetical protein [Bacillus subtilis subsp. subtilis]UWJ03526.1 hypothetical protein N0B18_04385 [Bacillus subtilis]WOP27700.1 hypothetical protein R0Q54_14890 [Bacillus subtilis]